mmetsp:Transcript_14439/g.33590  ORF Transcript_14439/g.33590 Transcript_14439/m.33590 type:complete len:89 (-) Transcript_14439:10-276(-)
MLVVLPSVYPLLVSLQHKPPSKARNNDDQLIVKDDKITIILFFVTTIFFFPRRLQIHVHEFDGSFPCKQQRDFGYHKCMTRNLSNLSF